MRDPEAINYKEIEFGLLEERLKSDGMVFVRVSKSQATRFIKSCEKDSVIDKYKYKRPGLVKRLFDIVNAMFSLLCIFIFSKKLIELQAFKDVNKIRCTWEIQENGEYVLIFS